MDKQSIGYQNITQKSMCGTEWAHCVWQWYYYTVILRVDYAIVHLCFGYFKIHTLAYFPDVLQYDSDFKLGESR
jgi:hypothetical protein